MAAGMEQMRELMAQYGVPAAEIVNIINQIERLNGVQRDVKDLITGHGALKDLLAKPDFLKDLCEKGCTEDIKKMMEAAWKAAGDDLAEDFTNKISQCVTKDLSKTQSALAEQADGLFHKKAEELAHVNKYLDGIKILCYFTQCMKISQELQCNEDTVRFIRADLERLRTRHVTRVQTMLNGGAKLTANELTDAEEDFSSLLQRLQAAAEKSKSLRQAAGLVAISSGLDFLAGVGSVSQTWFVLSRSTRCWFAVKSAAQAGLALSASYSAYLAHVQLGDINMLMNQINAYIANIRQAQRMVGARLGGA